MTRKNPRDYTLNRDAAKDLAYSIQSSWRQRGYDSVEVWVETIPVYNKHTGERLTTRFELNSNIIQSVSSLERGHVF